VLKACAGAGSGGGGAPAAAALKVACDMERVVALTAGRVP
jgi:hypothetical protein